jgi:hypothetical protein
MTMSEKLAAVEAEAREAQDDTIASLHPVGAKRTISGVPKTKRKTKRRSTLNPDELAELMGMES